VDQTSELLAGVATPLPITPRAGVKTANPRWGITQLK
jgi:hypothetical protein